MGLSLKKSRAWARDRPFVILIAIQLALLVADTVLNRNGGNTLLASFLIAFFVVSVTMALRSVNMDVRGLKKLGFFAITFRLSEYFFHFQALSIALNIIWGAFSLLMVIRLIEFALRRDQHETFTKLAAVASAYIAFPQFWNSIFLLIQAADPQAFHPGLNEKLPLDYQSMLLFSYNVFTTVDVSDTLPASRLACVAVVLAEIVAQLFVVILIARLVGVFPNENAKRQPSSALKSPKSDP